MSGNLLNVLIGGEIRTSDLTVTNEADVKT
jgi:hypothetical protein